MKTDDDKKNKGTCNFFPPFLINMQKKKLRTEMGNMSKRELDLRSDKKNMYSGRSRRTFANVNGFFLRI